MNFAFSFGLIKDYGRHSNKFSSQLGDNELQLFGETFHNEIPRQLEKFFFCLKFTQEFTLK